MKRLTCSDIVIISIVIILLVGLALLFVWVTNADAQVSLPSISAATCEKAFLEWRVDDYTYSLIKQVRILYESEGYGYGDLSTTKYYDLGWTHWWVADVPYWFVAGHEWIVTGYVELTNGQTYATTNFLRVDCRHKVHLPVIRK